jgi:hypothetical protein
MEKKRTAFKTGYEELLEYIKGYKLSLSMSTAIRSTERFLAQSKRLVQDSPQAFSLHEEKELCKATKKMIEGAQQFQASQLDKAVERIMIKAITSRECHKFMDCYHLISNGLQQAMTSVINNDAFTELSPTKPKRDRDAKSPNDRYGSSRRGKTLLQELSPTTAAQPWTPKTFAMVVEGSSPRSIRRTHAITSETSSKDTIPNTRRSNGTPPQLVRSYVKRENQITCCFYQPRRSVWLPEEEVRSCAAIFLILFLIPSLLSLRYFFLHSRPRTKKPSSWRRRRTPRQETHRG